MAPPIVVTISHSRGAAEAQKRIAEGLEKARRELAVLFPDASVVWTANHADVKMIALRQQATAGVDVYDDTVRIEVALPWYLAPLQEKLVRALERQSEKALQIEHRKA